MCVKRGVCSSHGSGRGRLHTSVLGRIPALERVPRARGRGQGAVLAAVLHDPGRFGSLAAVTVERKRVRVHRPVRVQDHVTGHRLAEVVFHATIFGSVPVPERVPRAGWIRRLRGLGPVFYRLRGDCRTAVRIERHRIGPDSPMRVHGRIRRPHGRGWADLASPEGFFGRMKTESVYPERWEERTRDEVLVLIDDYIRWYNHERIKQSLGWMSPVQYRQSQGMAA